MRISAIGLTDVGLQREHNEDTFRIVDQHSLYLVADGMGGHQAGDVASKMAADIIVSFFDSTQQEDATWPFPVDPHLTIEENRLTAAIKLANRQIFNLSHSDPSLHGMGTTIVGLTFLLEQNLAYIAHVGDSRAYRIREGEVTQITRDHSLVNDYLNMMPDMPLEAMEVVPKNVITRALGMQESVVVDIGRKRIQPGDRFLLCTDGLSGMVPDARLKEVVDGVDSANLEERVKELIKAANEAGGEDNITVVMVSLDE
jgi:serine/threonine protein phosphatase PrpC